LDDNRAVRIAGANGTMWLQVSASDIFGEFRVSVEGGSTRALNPATRAQRGIQTMQTVIPALSQLGYDPTNAMRMALRDMGYDPNYIMVLAEQAPEEALMEELPMEGEMAPEMAPMEEQAPPSLDQLMAQMQPPAQAPVEQIQQEFGGPGVPGATNGTLAL
jgi:hypothetical protein